MKPATATITPETRARLKELARWWRRHRPAARPLHALFRATLERIKAAPLGVPVHDEIEGVAIRRMRIDSTPYHAYYVVTGENRVVVIDVWSGQRGHGFLDDPDD